MVVAKGWKVKSTWILELFIHFHYYFKRNFLYGTVVWEYTAETDLQKLQVLQNKICERIHGVSWYVTNHIIQKDLHINTLRVEIIKHSKNSITNLLTNPNEEIFNIDDYHPFEFPRMPRAVLHLQTAIHLSDPPF